MTKKLEEFGKIKAKVYINMIVFDSWIMSIFCFLLLVSLVPDFSLINVMII